MIAYQRPQAPPEFSRNPTKDKLWKKIEKTRDDIRIAVDYQSNQYPESKDFSDHWTNYKHLFEEAQGRGKCIYCESRITGSAYGAVEHYRPKAGLTKFMNRGNRDDLRNQLPKRKFLKQGKPGYWWLAYDWNNWLYSCDRCNSTWKGNQFPVIKQGEHMPMFSTHWTPAEGAERQEKPLLLNPFNTNPSPHFRFDEVGNILPKSMEGWQTIEVCGLDRKKLVRERFLVASAIMRQIDAYIIAASDNHLELEKASLKELLALCKDSASFAGMARDLLKGYAELDYVDLLHLEKDGLI